MWSEVWITKWKGPRLGSPDTGKALQPLQKPGMLGALFHTKNNAAMLAYFRRGYSVKHACFLTAGIKMAVTTLVSTEMMKENWPLGAPSPLSPLGPAETSSSDTRILEGKIPPGGWRWLGFHWPTEVCLWWTTRPTLTGITVSPSAKRFWLHGSIWHFVKSCLLKSKGIFQLVLLFSPSLSRRGRWNFLYQQRKGLIT